MYMCHLRLLTNKDMGLLSYCNYKLQLWWIGSTLFAGSIYVVMLLGRGILSLCPCILHLGKDDLFRRETKSNMVLWTGTEQCLSPHNILSQNSLSNSYKYSTPDFQSHFWRIIRNLKIQIISKSNLYHHIFDNQAIYGNHRRSSTPKISSRCHKKAKRSEKVLRAVRLN